MSLDAIPASVQSFLVSEGILTADQAASDWWTAFDAVPSGLKAIVLGMCQEADDETQLTALKAELQAVIDQIKINNLAAEVWQARKEIAAADWPASEALQEDIAALLTADAAAYPPPGDPPEPPNPDSLDPVKRAAQITSLTAALASANNILDQLATGAESGSVDWPSSSTVGNAMLDWLEAQGMDPGDLAPVTDAGDVLSPQDSELAESWSAWKLTEGTFYSLGNVGTASAGDAANMVLYDDGKFYKVTSISVANWGGGLSGGLEAKFYIKGHDSIVLDADTTFTSLIPDNLGEKVTINGEELQLWSDGTTIYQVHPEKFKDVTTASLKSAISGEPWDAFIACGALVAYEPAATDVTTVQAVQRSNWSDFFQEKLGDLTASTNGFSMLMSTEATRTKEMVTNWESHSDWLSYQLKIWAAALKCFSSRL